MAYYSSALTTLGSLETTPLRSLLSKMVDPTEYGKIFTILMVLSSLTSLVKDPLFQEAYAETVATFPGFIFLLSAGLQTFAMVCTVFNCNLNWILK